jgi:hypothetical protein
MPGEVAKLAELSQQVPTESPAMQAQGPRPRNLRRRLSSQMIEEMVTRYTGGRENTRAQP